MPRKNKQRGKASPKTSKNRKSPRDTAVFTCHEHVGLVPRMTTPDNQVFTIVQTTGNGIIQQASTAQFNSLKFYFGQLTQYSQLANVFDQYRIDEVQVTFRPMFLSTQVSGSTTFYIPQLYVVVDYDDAATPSSVASLQAYANCNSSMYETVNVRFAPHVALGAYASSAFSSYANTGPMWIDMTSTGVEHYGVKTGIDPGGSGQTSFQSWGIITKMRVSMRNVR